jgi:tetratricopeptide (TPR) repeat protein
LTVDSLQLLPVVDFERGLILRTISISPTRNTIRPLASWVLPLFGLLNWGPLRADDVRALLARGDELCRQFDEGSAVAQYEKAHQLDPNSFEALEGLARASEDFGNKLATTKSRDAEGYFTKAIRAAELMRQQRPDRAEPYFYLAAAYGSLALAKHGTEKIRLGAMVEEYAQKAIALNPAYAPAYAVLGVFYREVARLNWIERALATSFFGPIPPVHYEDSIRMLVKAVELYPTSLYAHYQLGLTYEDIGQRSQAMTTWIQTVALSPRNSFEVELKAEAERRLKDLGNLRQQDRAKSLW